MSFGIMSAYENTALQLSFKCYPYLKKILRYDIPAVIQALPNADDP